MKQNVVNNKKINSQGKLKSVVTKPNRVRRNIADQLEEIDHEFKGNLDSNMDVEVLPDRIQMEVDADQD